MKGFVLVAAMCVLPGLALAGPVVKTNTGKVEGVAKDGVEVFKGIPFAAPPTGDLRWRAPQPVKTWTGVRPATAFGADCMQEPFPRDDAPLTTTPAEDCLYVNVWRPSGVAKPLPVMVWIYGGGFVNGGSSPKIYDGSAFAKGGVIYVSFNYRLGRFGFFGHPALTKADADHGLLGNYAYMDQVAALKWVQANIAAFGGDPGQVTIFGESAGGSSVHFLLHSPQAKGLFHRAIVQSGGGRGGAKGPRLLSADRPDMPSSETLGGRFAQRMGITATGPDALAALRALPAAQVTDGLNLANRSEDAGGPMIDGQLVTEEPGLAYLAGRQTRVPLMVGANSADSGDAGAKSKDELFAQFGDRADAARTAYDPDGTKDLRRLNAEVGMDRGQIEPARFVAANWAGQGLKAYHYRFSWTATPRRATSPFGAPHATEIPFVMDTVTDRYGAEATAEDLAVAKITHAYWLNFAKTGNPNGNGVDGKPLPEWPVYDAADQIMDITAEGTAVAKPDPWKARLDVTAAVAKAPAKVRVVTTILH